MKKKRKKLNLKKEYENCWNYIKESKRFIYLAIALFLVFALIGFFIPTPANLSNQIMVFIEELLAKLEGMSQGQLIGFIFFNNLRSSFFGLVLGGLFGVIPGLFAISNGYILGFVSSLSVAENGVKSLLSLLPHGIFELPAIFLSLGLGLKFGMFIFQKKRIEAFKEYLSNSLKIFLLIILPLLLIAGIIEGYLIYVS
jgi:stage II sporulation protein M